MDSVADGAWRHADKSLLLLEPASSGERVRASTGGEKQMDNRRVKTDIKGLDEMLNGGFLPQTANLVEGPPGTGKSTLGMQFIYNGIRYHDEPG